MCVEGERGREGERERQRQRERERIGNLLDTMNAFSQIDSILIETNKIIIKNNSLLPKLGVQTMIYTGVCLYIEILGALPIC